MRTGRYRIQRSVKSVAQPKTHERPSYPRGALRHTNQTSFLRASPQQPGQDTVTTDIPVGGWGVITKVSSETSQAPRQLQAGVRGSAQGPGAWLQGFTLQGEANARPACRPVAHGLEKSPGQRVQAGRLWLGLPGLAVREGQDSSSG